MRLLIINLLAITALLVSAATAGAYSLQAVATTATSGEVGDIVSFDVFLNTEGDIGLNLLSVSLTYDPAVVAYRPDLSGTNGGYYPVYAVSGKNSNWLVASPTNLGGLNPLFCGAAGDTANMCDAAPGEWAGNLPAIGGQVNVDFVSSSAPTQGLYGSTDSLNGGSSVVQLATVSFELIGFGTSAGAFGFGNGGNIAALTGAVDVTDSTGTSGDVTMSAIPEPTTALLVGLGLVGLGVAGRRRA